MAQQYQYESMSSSSSSLLREHLQHAELLQFPWKLHVVLDHAERTGETSVISWVDDRWFQVKDPKRFESHILSRFFPNESLQNFQETMAYLGFKERKGQSKYSYSHDFFIRGRPDMCSRVTELLYLSNNNNHTRSDSSKESALMVSSTSSPDEKASAQEQQQQQQQHQRDSRQHSSGAAAAAAAAALPYNNLENTWSMSTPSEDSVCTENPASSETDQPQKLSSTRKSGKRKRRAHPENLKKQPLVAALHKPSSSSSSEEQEQDKKRASKKRRFPLVARLPKPSSSSSSSDEPDDSKKQWSSSGAKTSGLGIVLGLPKPSSSSSSEEHEDSKPAAVAKTERAKCAKAFQDHARNNSQTFMDDASEMTSTSAAGYCEEPTQHAQQQQQQQGHKSSSSVSSSGGEERSSSSKGSSEDADNLMDAQHEWKSLLYARPFLDNERMDFWKEKVFSTGEKFQVSFQRLANNGAEGAESGDSAVRENPRRQDDDDDDDDDDDIQNINNMDHHDGSCSSDGGFKIPPSEEAEDTTDSVKSNSGSSSGAVVLRADREARQGGSTTSSSEISSDSECR